MAYEDNLFKCSTNDCLTLSIIIGFIFTIILLGVTAFIYKKIVNNAKKYYEIENQITN